MSLADFFAKECVDATLNNIKIGLQKLAEPMDLLSFNISGALVDAVKGGLGGLTTFGEDYLLNNSDVVAYSMVQALGAEKIVDKTLNQVFGLLSFAQMANNTFVFILLKYVARNCIERLHKKREILFLLRERLTQLNNCLLTMNSGPSDGYDRYLTNMRIAMVQLVSARNDLRIVKSALYDRDIYLSKTYENARYKVRAAQTRLRPSTGGNPFTTPFYEPGKTNVFKNATLKSVGGAAMLSGVALLETQGPVPHKEQIDAMLAIPKCCQNIIKAMAEYSSTLSIINILLATYEAGTGSIIKEMNRHLKKFALDHLGLMIGELNTLTNEMFFNLVNDPVTLRAPNPVKVTAYAFKWTAQTSMIISQMKLLPTEALTAATADVAFYNDTVEQLKKLDSVTISASPFISPPVQATLQAVDAQEQVAGFEQQILALMLSAVNCIPKTRVDNRVLSLARVLIGRVDLTLSRDTEIERILQSFVDYKLEGEDFLTKLIQQAEDMMRKAGLDKAMDLFKTGDFVSFFGLNGKTATYVGAALMTVALLKQCFDTVEQQEEVAKIQNALERNMDLLNLKLSFDFDLAIFKNIDLCLRVNGLADLFNIKESFCGLTKSISVSAGDAFKALGDYVGNEWEQYKMGWKEAAEDVTAFSKTSEENNANTSAYYKAEWQKNRQYWPSASVDVYTLFKEDGSTRVASEGSWNQTGFPFPPNIS